MAESREIAALRTQVRRLTERVDELERQLEEHRNFEPDTTVADCLESTEHFVFAMLLIELHETVPDFSIGKFREKILALQEQSNAAMPSSNADERLFGAVIAARTNELIAELIPPVDKEDG
ncbi:hypothetical protein CXZ10_06040 [Pleomorphomonas diazotrophica]|uniref:Uncharacterized protein n=1 Tax=Pleomorphomonas diazotrophica TaxID=1166257 RepID=A0A1I4Q668_9HYPH|nr:hypothetical protein [Pleomorphomonas diazotrophica]PKR90905.1 hypothetical protein CXZ10_06040 [Pleomorphomonas diazotrophica]SFM35598.1 hypothetical protein SAMN05192571_101103 [Pleomorphomonas diazotrophica]